MMDWQSKERWRCMFEIRGFWQRSILLQTSTMAAASSAPMIPKVPAYSMAMSPPATKKVDTFLVPLNATNIHLSGCKKMHPRERTPISIIGLQLLQDQQQWHSIESNPSCPFSPNASALLSRAFTDLCSVRSQAFHAPASPIFSAFSYSWSILPSFVSQEKILAILSLLLESTTKTV